MKKLLLFSLTAFLVACFGGGEPIPQDQFYRLANATYKSEVKLKSIAKVIAVSTLDSDALHRERAILYSDVSEPLKLQRYHYHHWSNIPSRLVQDNLVDYLRSSGIGDEVIRYGEQAHVDVEIGGQLKKFERVVGASNPGVIVQLELFYKTRGRNSKRLQYVYTQEVSASDTSMNATALAFSKALQSIYADFIQDILKHLDS